MKPGLLLFAHGARDPRWAEPFDAVAARLRRREPTLQIRLAFLEFMPPTLAEAGESLVSAGCDRVDVLPLFLGAGGHVRNDLPRLLEALAGAHPGVQWRLQPAIGEFDGVVDAMAAAAAGVLREASA